MADVPVNLTWLQLILTAKPSFDHLLFSVPDKNGYCLQKWPALTPQHNMSRQKQAGSHNQALLLFHRGVEIPVSWTLKNILIYSGDCMQEGGGYHPVILPSQLYFRKRRK